MKSFSITMEYNFTSYTFEVDANGNVSICGCKVADIAKQNNKYIITTINGNEYMGSTKQVAFNRAFRCLLDTFMSVSIEADDAEEEAEVNEVISKRSFNAIAKFNAELDAFAIEAGETEATLYEDELTSFTLSNIRIEGNYLCYRYDGREEKELVVKYDEEENTYYEDTINGISEYIKFWRRCLKRAKKYWEMNSEDIDSMQESILDGIADPNQDEED